jgi:hypothetical protein
MYTFARMEENHAADYTGAVVKRVYDVFVQEERFVFGTVQR